ncbi:GNAT family N-acetyltransferase [Terrarubrum flagellatum]|uniref:GNAT family N-acetyltransferase n=1 Tax=Terrirubrum flagellatum TaxID=2895980 RepID=UPI00314518FA
MTAGNRIERKAGQDAGEMMHASPSLFSRLAPTGLSAAPLIAVERDFARAAPLLREFERANPGQLFQRLDWVAAWAETQGRAQGVEPVIVILCDATGAPVALLPLGVRNWRAVRIVEWLGGEHASFNLPLTRGDGLRFDSPDAAKDCLRAIGRAIGDVDVFSLASQPRAFQGRAHPFLGVGETPLFDHGYERALGGSGEVLISRILTGDARKKLRAKEKRLGEAGAIKVWRAEFPNERQAALDVFLKQSAERFAKAGIANPFDDPAAIAFLQRATNPAEGPPAIALHLLSVGDRIVAIFGGPQDSARFSGMFTSFHDAPEIARNSPGDILLRHLVASLSDAGLTEFDLGVGEARYKRAYCDRAIPMFETYLACSSAGFIVAKALQSKAIAKRFIKARPELLAFTRRVLPKSLV